MDLEKLKFPIGRFSLNTEFSEEDIDSCLVSLSDLPNKLQLAIDGVSDELMQSPYRTGAWTRNQVVHHLADTHINAYSRCKMAYTDKTPAVTPYDQNLWSELPDAGDVNIGASVDILHGIHYRWNRFWESIDLKDFKKEYFHPDFERKVPLTEVLQYFSWHGEHHTAQIGSLWSQ
ncbi:MAG: Putative metal-dependent hydrolase YfiT [Owenweeksia sp. TMED14]|nr:MAG: Putative metal-dependent hydrolase YfiT [Owenweeksia sp. TMED14]